MDPHGTCGGSNVPAFLAKLWTLVEDPDTDPLICWSPEGNSFHVFDQGQFAKEVLPKYFKHNNMASFVRQLNMYGFRKVVHIEQGGLVKPERDDTEFQHPYFIRGQEQLLENIKRKVNTMSATKSDEVKVRQDSVGKLISDVQSMKGKQESIDGRLLSMKHENEALWREVASLRQKHTQQQKVVNKLIQFLVSLVQSNRILGVKRKIPLMLNDSSTAHSSPKYSRQYSLEHVHSSSTYPAQVSGFTDSALYSPDSLAGPIISDVTELAESSPSPSPCPSLEGSPSPVILIKEEPLTPSHSPEQSPAPPKLEDTPISPSTFIDSILQENEASVCPGGNKNGVSQSHPPEPCLSVACLDNVSSSRQMSEVSRLFPTSCSSVQGRAEPPGMELNDHVDTIDFSLDNLQNLLSGQSFSVDTSALMDLFSPSLGISELSLPDPDSSLASIQELLSSQDQKASETESGTPDTGKQIVHYTAQPLILMDSTDSDLPILLELEGDEPYIEEEGDDYSEDPTLSLISWDPPSKPAGSSIS
ncbi:heat shock transcription factor 1 S homeolog [Xenopus laevis]|uniref:Heat shock transcription factor 1 S homeolog n=1 Tax=Xenopus laevis TaxID=8355 RepID=Q5PQ93_XENLA|nr:heat shock transcription factor 1 S homeolog [Xenopus laevis]AAH87308.1 MGC99052 protein [Xenopus laevis]